MSRIDLDQTLPTRTLSKSALTSGAPQGPASTCSSRNRRPSTRTTHEDALGIAVSAARNALSAIDG
jgi:hypothetical protein